MNNFPKQKLDRPSSNMDTKYWGPSGWRLLHLIAENETIHGRNGNSLEFWTVLPYILPCKFCRTSLTTYYEKYPIPRDNQKMSHWLYKIHNCVNDKLREQGQNIPHPPPYSAVKKHYRGLLGLGCTELTFPGWEFLFCIADNYPGSVPTPDTPMEVGDDDATKNKYNLLTKNERISYLAKFWASLADVMPFKEWRDAMAEYCSRGAESCAREFNSSRAAKKKLWEIKCSLEKTLGEKSMSKYYDLCRTIASKRSGCSSSTKARTCRAVKPQRDHRTIRHKSLKKKHSMK